MIMNHKELTGNSISERFGTKDKIDGSATCEIRAKKEKSVILITGDEHFEHVGMGF